MRDVCRLPRYRHKSRRRVESRDLRVAKPTVNVMMNAGLTSKRTNAFAKGMDVQWSRINLYWVAGWIEEALSSKRLQNLT